MKKQIEVKVDSFYNEIFYMTLEQAFIFLQDIKAKFIDYTNLRFVPSGYDVILYGTREETDLEYYTRLEKEKKEEESTDASKDLKMELDDIKSTENYDGEEEDEDDDDDDDEDSLKEAYMGLNLDENMGSDLDDVVNTFVNESEDYEDVSPISLLEDSEDSIFNLNSLLEQTQAIKDEVDSILSFNENEKFSNIMNENEIQDVLEENTDDYLL